MKRKRKIAVVTGTRAEYGLLFWIIKELYEDPHCELHLIVTGTHLSPEFGLTVNEIKEAGFPVAETVDMLLSSDTETAIATSMGLGMIGFAKAYERLKPDILVVLGDRWEILAALAASVPFRIPVAHIHGGESTEGAIDEQIRHSITKMSHIHFTATELYRKRVIQMGENPDHVFCFGAPGIDSIHRLALMEKHTLYSELGIPLDRETALLTYHPATLEKGDTEACISEVLSAVEEFPALFWVLTLPNADTGGRVIIRRLKDFIVRHPAKAKCFASLGQVRYLSLLRYACIMVGNSSSGLIEAPSFYLPVVNIGQRQRGRVCGSNVIDLHHCNKRAIIQAIDKAMSPDFRHSIQGMENPYGTGKASHRIVDTLRNLDIGQNIVQKHFFDFDGDKGNIHGLYGKK